MSKVAGTTTLQHPDPTADGGPWTFTTLEMLRAAALRCPVMFKIPSGTGVGTLTYWPTTGRGAPTIIRATNSTHVHPKLTDVHLLLPLPMPFINDEHVTPAAAAAGSAAIEAERYSLYRKTTDPAMRRDAWLSMITARRAVRVWQAVADGIEPDPRNNEHGHVIPTEAVA